MIDELDRIRRFGADEPPPSDQAWRDARAALAQAIARSAANDRPTRRLRRRISGSRRRQWLPRTVAVGVVLAVVALVIGVTSLGSAPSSALASALGRLARIAASGPSLLPGSGQYLYVDSRSNYPADAITGHQTCISYAVDHRQVWISANGSGLLQESTGPTTFTSPSDHATCMAMKPAPLTSSGTSRLWFAADCFELGPGNDMQGLSTHPRTLIGQMRRLDGGPVSPAEDFRHIGDFLRETDASPAVRAALYRAAALIPGVRLLGMVRDHIGRRGLGVAYTYHRIRDELIFNPRTSALMGEQDTGQAPGTDAWAVYLRSRVVDRLPHRSPLPLTPACVNDGGYITKTPHGDVQTGQKPNR